MTTNIEHPSDAQLVLALDGELERQQADTVAQHLAGCATCRARWQQFGGVSGQIVECHQALGSGRLRAPVAVIAVRQRIARAAGFIGAAAALALAALYVTRVEKSPPLTHRAEFRPQVGAPVLTKAAASPTLRKASRRKPARLVAADMSNIIELPFSDRALPLGEATVVRVELPIEELRLTGLLVDGGRAGTIVQADVLMGIDGLPRAIRLVQ